MQTDADLTHQRRVGPIPGHDQNVISRQHLPLPVALDHDLRGADLHDAGLESRRDRPLGDPILDVWPHPVLDRSAELGVTVDECHVDAGPKQFKRRLDS